MSHNSDAENNSEMNKSVLVLKRHSFVSNFAKEVELIWL